MLVGNKSDLKHLRAVPTDEASTFACKLPLLYYTFLNLVYVFHSTERTFIHGNICPGIFERY
jgi:hypothetical protein